MPNDEKDFFPKYAESGDRSGRDAEKDSFWDLEKLLPKKRSYTPAMRPFSTKEKVSEVRIPEKTNARSVSSGEARTPEEERKITILPDAVRGEESEESYRPQGHPFLRKVTIRRYADRFDFYDVFRKSALNFYDYPAKPCEFVPFYSYMPQYAQLDASQKAYYFYWRDCVRKRKYLPTERSYVLLYCFEILNLPDKIAPEEGLGMLCDVWAAYRDSIPHLDHYFAGTIQDYCLFYRLACPTERIADFLPSVLAEAPIREFYLADFSGSGEAGAFALTSYLSDYDWRSSRYAAGEEKEIYHAHMTAALALLIHEIRSEGFLMEGNGRAVTDKRNAFQNSVCTMKVKCRMEIEYYPLSQAIALRRAVTAAVRYIENKIRALLSVKSRLGVKDLPDRFREVIDAYFASAFEKMEKERKRALLPAYERRYDAPEEELSILNAEEIERSSWETTARLVEENADESAPAEQSAERPIPQQETTAAPYEPEEDVREEGNTAQSEEEILTPEEIAFLRACAENSLSEQKNIAAGLALPADAVAERINTAFSDGEAIGDVVLEPGDGGGYRLIEDYREEITEWLNQRF